LPTGQLGRPVFTKVSAPMAQPTWKNYALSGTAEGASEITDEAFEDRVEAEWHACAVDRKALKQLIKRRRRGISRCGWAC
jgi:hypothetical protein